MIWTSYYNKIKGFDKSKFYLVQISTSAPDFAKSLLDFSIKQLYPGFELVNKIKSGEIDQEQYTREYLSKLSEELVVRLDSLETLLLERDNKELVLFCWESPEKFCHRHILADYFNSHALGTKMKEYEFK